MNLEDELPLLDWGLLLLRRRWINRFYLGTLLLSHLLHEVGFAGAYVVGLLLPNQRFILLLLR